MPETETPAEGGTPEAAPTDEYRELRDALEKERTARKESDRKAKERDAFEAELITVREQGKSEQEKLLAKAVADADKAARTDERSKADRRVVAAEVKAAAGGRLHDPADAVLNIDLSEFQVDDDGNVDEKAIQKALDELLERKPYLAAKRNGSADQGGRPDNPPPAETFGKTRLMEAFK